MDSELLLKRWRFAQRESGSLTTPAPFEAVVLMLTGDQTHVFQLSQSTTHRAFGEAKTATELTGAHPQARTGTQNPCQTPVHIPISTPETLDLIAVRNAMI